MRSSRWHPRLLFSVLLLLVSTSCSNDDDGPILGPGPPPPPPPADGEGFFVSTSTGHDDSAGTKSSPFRTIGRALAAAAPLRVGVFVARGTYAEGDLNLRSGVDLMGGYHESTWQRDPAQNVTEIRGTRDTPTLTGVHAESLTVDGFTIRGRDQTTPRVSSICIVVAGTSKEIVISNNVILAGRGADGADGTEIVLGSGAGNGVNGAAPGICPRLGGGGGGSAAGYPGGPGGAGGAFDGSAGSAAPGSDGTYGGGGAGGTALSAEGKNGRPGRPGTNGTHGVAGGAIGGYSGAYVPADGANGTSGTAGRGGEGGGGASGNGFSCGAGGGGGGGGGRGGTEGTGGDGGAGSFGIVVNGNCTVTIRDNRITTAGGGGGGDAGFGSGGSSGGGGQGGELTLFASGGDGGNGGVGGNGGHGGPGGGGPSIAIAVVNSSDPTTRSGNVITLGTPGAGGITEAAGQPNAPAGIAAEFRMFD